MDLNEARIKIDELDSQLLALFVERMRLVSQIVEYKRSHHLEVFDPVREAKLLRWAAEAGGEEYGDTTRSLMEDMLAISRDFQIERLREQRHG